MPGRFSQSKMLYDLANRLFVGRVVAIKSEEEALKDVPTGIKKQVGYSGRKPVRGGNKPASLRSLDEA